MNGEREGGQAGDQLQPGDNDNNVHVLEDTRGHIQHPNTNICPIIHGKF